MIGLLSPDTTLFSQAASTLQESYGSIDVESAIFPWNTTNYYREEMGENLLRKFVAFGPLISPEGLVRIKRETNTLDDPVSMTRTGNVSKRCLTSSSHLGSLWTSSRNM